MRIPVRCCGKPSTCLTMADGRGDTAAVQFGNPLRLILSAVRSSLVLATTTLRPQTWKLARTLLRQRAAPRPTISSTPRLHWILRRGRSSGPKGCKALIPGRWHASLPRDPRPTVLYPPAPISIWEDQDLICSAILLALARRAASSGHLILITATLFGAHRWGQALRSEASSGVPPPMVNAFMLLSRIATISLIPWCRRDSK